MLVTVQLPGQAGFAHNAPSEAVPEAHQPAAQEGKDVMAMQGQSHRSLWISSWI